MVQEAEQMGADGIVNIRYSSSAIMQGAAEVIAYGTAVKFIWLILIFREIIKKSRELITLCFFFGIAILPVVFALPAILSLSLATLDARFQIIFTFTAFW